MVTIIQGNPALVYVILYIDWFVELVYSIAAHCITFPYSDLKFISFQLEGGN